MRVQSCVVVTLETQTVTVIGTLVTCLSQSHVFTDEGTKGWMVGLISQSWIEDKLRCWSGFTFTQQGPERWWAWIAVQTMLQSPFPGGREQTNTGEAAPLALRAHTVGTELRGVTSLRWPGRCSRGLSWCFWPGKKALCPLPWTSGHLHRTPSQMEEAHFSFTAGVPVTSKASIKLGQGLRLPHLSFQVLWRPVAL